MDDKGGITKDHIDKYLWDIKSGRRTLNKYTFIKLGVFNDINWTILGLKEPFKNIVPVAITSYTLFASIVAALYRIIRLLALPFIIFHSYFRLKNLIRENSWGKGK